MNRLQSSTSIRYYQRSLAATRCRTKFGVKAKLSLRVHHIRLHVDEHKRRSVFAPRIKPMAMGKKCCECRPDLNPYQANRCKHESRGILAYDRGQLVTDFAKLPDVRYESDQDVFAYEFKYDSDGAFDFEDKLVPPASKHSADSPPSVKHTVAKTDEVVTADPDTASEDLVHTDASDYESDTPSAAAPADSLVPQIACSDTPLTSMLQRQIAEAVTMGIKEIRADLQKCVVQEIQKLLPILVSGWERSEENVQAKLSGAVTTILERLDQRLPPYGVNPFGFPDADPFQPETDIMGNPVPVQGLGHKRPLEVSLLHAYRTGLFDTKTDCACLTQEPLAGQSCPPRVQQRRKSTA